MATKNGEQGFVSREGNQMRVTADQDKCCGAGLCVLNAPEVFDQRDEDGIVVVLDDSPSEELAAAVREAESLCPSGAISVRTADGADAGREDEGFRAGSVAGIEGEGARR